ncbi:hypothetical protein ACTXT7_008905 [Hymenolepis weldensis]
MLINFLFNHAPSLPTAPRLTPHLLPQTLEDHWERSVVISIKAIAPDPQTVKRPCTQTFKIKVDIELPLFELADTVNLGRVNWVIEDYVEKTQKTLSVCFQSVPFSPNVLDLFRVEARQTKQTQANELASWLTALRV